MSDEEKLRLVELDVERINIVDSKGNRKMSLFNAERMPNAVVDGQELTERGGIPSSGILFFNEEGDECGGLVFGSTKDENGNYRSDMSMTFDQYKGDQLLGLILHEEKIPEGKGRFVGITMWDRPEMDLRLRNEIKKMAPGPERDVLLQKLNGSVVDRLNFGRSYIEGQLNEIGVELNDSKGRPRMKMVVDSNDQPKIEIYNENGEVVYRLPPTVSEGGEE